MPRSLLQVQTPGTDEDKGQGCRPVAPVAPGVSSPVLDDDIVLPQEHRSPLVEFEPDGMHRTPTVDYGIVLDGEIWLELDEGRSALLRQHDVVVQNGTRHAWRNKSNRPATLAFVLIGACGLHLQR